MFDTPTEPSKDVRRFQELLQDRARPPYAHALLLGINRLEWPALLKMIEKGLPWSAFDRFVKSIGLRAEDIANLVGIPRRTLARRKAEGRLRPDESDRLLRLARLFSRALELFNGDHDAATEWLTKRKIALGGAVPLELAQTDIGAAEVDNLIGRLQHGIFS